jgi:hypothetical protein
MYCGMLLIVGKKVRRKASVSDSSGVVGTEGL